MRKVLAGLVVGVACYGLISTVLELAGDSTPSGSGFAMQGTKSEQAPGGGSRLLTTPEAAAPADRGEAEPPAATAATENPAVREARLRSALEQVEAAAARAEAELQDFVIERMLEDNPVIAPAPLPAVFDWVSSDTYLSVLHERFQREPVDAAWAAAIEADLARFIYEQPGVVERFGPPTVRCHTRRCEVLFVAAAGDGAAAGAFASGLFDQADEAMPGLFDCEENLCMANANDQDGITTIFWGMVITRKISGTQSLVADARQ